MGNRVVIFPVSKETEARAYAAWTDANNPFTPAPPADNSGSWSYVRNDVDGQWVVPFLGAPWVYAGNVYEEPAGGEAMRVDGVLHDTAEFPEEEEA